MRTVQLITQPAGGPVDHAVDIACELAQRGHDSHLIGPCAGFAPRLAQAGVSGHDLAMASKHDVHGAVGLGASVRALRPDVLHCQDRRAGLAGRALGRLMHTPGLVYTLHGVADGLSDLVQGNVRAAPRRRRDSLYYLSAERWLNSATGGRVVVPSHAVARFAIESIRLREAVVDIVPNGVDVERFAPRPRAGHAASTAVWLGVMSPVKRLDVLLEALAEVPDLQLRLVGTGPDESLVQKMIAERGMRERVQLLGHVDDPVSELATSDLFVLPSAAENCPLALLQAMACGLPVVASRVGGIPEVVRDGVEGVLVPPGDAAALARALRSLVVDPARARDMGARGRSRICERYTVRTCVDGLLDAYGKALSCT